LFCQTFHFSSRKKCGYVKKKKKSETQTQLGENEKQEKKAMQQEREPNKEPIKKGEGKHCADQAVSSLKKKQETQPGEGELNKDKDTGKTKKRPGCKQIKIELATTCIPLLASSQEEGLPKPSNWFEVGSVGSLANDVLWFFC